MRDLTELNINEGGKPVSRRKPLQSDIEAFEQHFRVVLPKSYVFLLQFSNGGHPEVDSFCVNDDPADLWNLNHFYHLLPEVTDSENLWEETSNLQGILGSGVVPIGDDGGGNTVFLSYDSDPPNIKLVIVDSMEIVKVCDTFERFIDNLRMNPDYL